MINVLVVHEFPLMCNIIASVVDDEPDIKVFGYVSDIDEAMSLASNNEIDLVLISSRLPDQGTIRLTNLLIQNIPTIKVLILGITETRESVLEYVEAGATGYVLKESSLDDLLTTIRAVYEGKALISPEIAAALIQRVSEFAQVFSQTGLNLPESLNLTAREFEVLELLSQSLSNQEIAGRLVIETGTVKNHVHSILNKMGVGRREEAGNLMPLIKEKFKGKT
jgi:DNA-binding NarL/FixJ family response regulator